MAVLASEERAEKFQHALSRVRQELAKVVVGLEEVVDQVLVALLSGGHVLLEGVPGVGKTLLVRTLSQCLDLHSQRIQFTPDLMPADILGAHVLIEDKINRCTPKTQAALLEAMQELAVTVGGERHVLEAPFFTIATQNPIEMEGTYPLPEAQLDRFFFKVLVPRPGREALKEIGRRTTGPDDPEAETVIKKNEVLEMQQFVREIPVPETVEDYAAGIILASSPDDPSAPKDVRDFVRYGASPRGMQALLLGARANALLEGRFSAASSDIRTAAFPALRHRLILNFEAEAEGLQPDSLVQSLLDAVPRPGQP